MLSDRKIKWGILGTSPISDVMAKAIQESSTSELAAIGSRSLAKAQAFAMHHSIPIYYGDQQTLLEDPTIDAVYIGLPNHLHKEWIIRCAQAGKHILCEKPFVISPTEAHDVIAEVKKTNVVCMEALMYRYHPLTAKLQTLIQTKAIGDVKLFHAAYTANIAAIANPTAGGSIRNLGCYPISLVRLLANGEPIGITAYGRRDQHGNDNQASAILKFEHDVVAVVSTADDMDMVWQFDVYGTEGHLSMITNPWMPDQTKNTIVIRRNKHEQPIEINVTADKSLYTYQIDAMNETIINGDAFSPRSGAVTWQDSLGNITVLDAWLKQLQN